ncbi:hypothetical protein V8D89_005453 [Ganoderma adspersum]
MAALLLVPLTIMVFLSSYIPGTAAQGTNATCNSGFEWMTNSKNQNPCLVSSWLFTPCSSPSDSFVFPLTPGFHYNTPLNSSDSATPCRCNTILFSTIAACATCQGGANDIVPWILYSQNCSAVSIQKYPENIPSGTAIPAWAYLDVRINGTFDAAAAEAVAAQDLPESTALPAPSTTQTSSSNTSTPSPLSTTTSGAASGTTAAVDDNSSSGSKKSNAGAIAGGVVGGLAGLALIGVAVFFALRFRSGRSAASGGKQKHNVYGAGAQSSEKSPVISGSTHRVYDPNDPRTFPDQDPYANVPSQGSIAYLAADTSAGVVGSNFNDGYRGAGGPNAYRGAPEL